MSKKPIDCELRQMPAYQENPASGAAEPKPLPMFFIVSVTVMRERYFTLL